MNKIILVVIALFIFSAQQVSAEEKPIVVATASMIFDIAKNIGKEHVDVKCIVPIGGDPHTYKPTPSDAKLVVNCDLILKNGLTFEGWLNELIANSGTKAPSVLVTKGIQPIKSLTYDAPDPHAWMNVIYGITYAENVMKGLVDLLPEHKTDFEKNFQNYKKELEELDKYIIAQINTIPKEKRILITSHDAFQYYGRKYGLQLESILGTSTDADIQAEDVINLQKIIKKSKVPAVFIESTVNPKTLQQLAKDTKIAIGGKLLSDSIGDEELGGETYVEMLKQNTDVIVEALTKDQGNVTSIVKDGDSTSSYIMTGVIGLMFLLGIVFMFSKNR